ncbi:vacuolar protein sorting-associated protein 51 [Anaeramoeba flamelloides]|uniref:Vacuolar protein sorting-associated protein 51 homolog n=1 Tax=Anaeramoeba flamelloides TaxID=1746091 RepID=A0AAV7Z3S0_9EUKA|nr:vacuolar protein sorting-associated protein 51 [Anaeramoeba flamelloides]
MSEQINESDLRKKNLKKLLQTYYGNTTKQTKKSLKKEQLDLDSGRFQVDLYFNKIIKENNIEKLVQQQKKTKKELKEYDNSLQKLVYQNYHKFLSATDMIKDMSSTVDNMEGEINKLTMHMKNLEKYQANIDNKMNVKRTKINNLINNHELVTKLQFLFELPQKMRLCIKMGEHSQAVNDYLKCCGALHRHSNLASFQGIISECNEIVSEIKKYLFGILRDRQSKKKNINQVVRLLISLDVPLDQLTDDLLLHKSSKIIKVFESYKEKEFKELKLQLEEFKLRNKKKLRTQTGKNENENENENDKELKIEMEKDQKENTSFEENLSNNFQNSLSSFVEEFIDEFVWFSRSYKKLFLNNEIKEKRKKEIKYCERRLKTENEKLFNQFFEAICPILFNQKLKLSWVKKIIGTIINHIDKTKDLISDPIQCNKIEKMINNCLNYHINLKFSKVIYRFKKFFNIKNQIFSLKMNEYFKKSNQKGLIGLKKNEDKNNYDEEKNNNNKEKIEEITREREKENDNKKETEREKIKMDTMISDTFNEINLYIVQNVEKLVVDLSYLFGILEDFSNLKKNFLPVIKQIRKNLNTNFNKKYFPILIGLLQINIQKLFLKINKIINNYNTAKKNNAKKNLDENDSKQKNEFTNVSNFYSDYDFKLLNPYKNKTETETEKRKGKGKGNDEEQTTNAFFYLVLSKIMNSLFEKDIINFLGEFSWLFGEEGFHIASSIGSNPNRNHKENKKCILQLDELMGKCDIKNIIENTELISISCLNRFVFLHGRNLSQLIINSIETPNWILVGQPKGVRIIIQQLFNQFKITNKIILSSFEKERKDSSNNKKNNANSETESVKSWSSRSKGSNISYSMKDSNFASRNERQDEKYRLIENNIEKLFSNKIQIFENIEPNRDSIITGIGKMALKGFIESVRQTTFGTNGFNQIQVDSFFLRVALSKFIERSVLNYLSDEIVDSASRRCLKPAKIDPSLVESICKEILEKIMI